MFIHRRKSDIPEDNSDRWLLTYADLITLLLAFFIVMYSMSRIDAKKFGKVSQALHGILKGGPSILRSPDVDNSNTGHGLLKVGSLKMLQTKINGELDKIGRRGDIVTEINERGLTIHIMESAMFDEAEAELKPRARELLDLVAADILGMPNHVRVEGHTDSSPIRTSLFPSNWELSATRATQVVRYLIEKHSYPAEKISAAGFASYRPFVPNTTLENKAKNRRVDIVVQTMELSIAEPSSELDQFTKEQLEVMSEISTEIDSSPGWNNFPENQ
ncbi:MAG: flagellar motor protein MotB [candidate division Zixibacteria bacterium]